jgi:hypothetical protein
MQLNGLNNSLLDTGKQSWSITKTRHTNFKSQQTKLKANGKKKGTEPWTTQKTRSKGWLLLYCIWMDDSASNMTKEELLQSDPHFSCYPFEDFVKYDSNMIGKTLYLFCQVSISLLTVQLSSLSNTEQSTVCGFLGKDVVWTKQAQILVL